MYTTGQTLKLGQIRRLKDLQCNIDRLNILESLWALELDLVHVLLEIYIGLDYWSSADMDV